MTETLRPELHFLADDPALDFLNSVAAPWGTEIEWLRDGRDFLAWLLRARLISADVVVLFQELASSGGLDQMAAEARDLREWFRGFVAARAGRRLEPSALGDLERLNPLLARDQSYRRIEAWDGTARVGAGPTLRWRRHRRWRAPEDLLLPIAEVMGDLVCQGDFAMVKNCGGPSCTMWFHDLSKNHRRRWCSMAVCGNRAKAAAHRAKKRGARRQQ